PCATEPAKTGMLEDLDQLFGLVLARQARFEQAIAASPAIGVEADKFGDCRMCLTRRDGSSDTLHCGVLVQRMADRHDRRAMAAAHARSADNAYAVAKGGAQPIKELHPAGQLAAQTVAHSHGQRRRGRLVGPGVWVVPPATGPGARTDAAVVVRCRQRLCLLGYAGRSLPLAGNRKPASRARRLRSH